MLEFGCMMCYYLVDVCRKRIMATESIYVIFVANHGEVTAMKFGQVNELPRRKDLCQGQCCLGRGQFVTIAKHFHFTVTGRDFLKFATTESRRIFLRLEKPLMYWESPRLTRLSLSRSIGTVVANANYDIGV